jgi:uncharacterized membrane protein YcfT
MLRANWAPFAFICFLTPVVSFVMALVAFRTGSLPEEQEAAYVAALSNVAQYQILGVLAGLAVMQHPLWNSILLPTTAAIIIGIQAILSGGISLVIALRGGGWVTKYDNLQQQ